MKVLESGSRAIKIFIFIYRQILLVSTATRIYLFQSILILIIQTEQSSSKVIPGPVDGQDISNFTISGVDLIAMYNFATESKLRMIFDLNVLLRNPVDESWNDTNAREIIAFAKAHNMELDWQLGNGRRP